MTREEITKQAVIILTGLVGLNKIDAVMILSESMQLIVSQTSTEDRLDEPCMTFKIGFLRRRSGGLNRIEKDPEVQEFIHSLDHYYINRELLEMIEKRFGKERTPSKSGLSRYLQRITKVFTQKSRGQQS